MDGSLQLIDAEKQFNENVSGYLDSLGVLNNGLNYHVVSVFGSQSTGKSTLLNALFSTQFQVMNETSRQQTTKGIWMAKAEINGSASSSEASDDSYLNIKNPPEVENHKDCVLVLDVEGTDGRERGEDQDFERKSALFALATSEVIIVNMWENQVGLYQGANMGLLKTVFEVNLSLFQASSEKPSRSLILFVIRDHIGATPLENLSATLLADLNKHWESISKPESLKETKISDFFDIQFQTLPHKILLPDQFSSQVYQLSRRFVPGRRNSKETAALSSDSYVFRPEYHRNVPIDGWNMYAANIWEQIEQNKDLDLPSQQILVARFRCGEIASQTKAQFEAEFGELESRHGTALSDGKTVISDFGQTIAGLRTRAMELYDSLASRYTAKVYQGQRLDLLSQIDSRLLTVFRAHLSALHSRGLQVFNEQMVNSVNGMSFADALETSRKQALQFFETRAEEASSADREVFMYHGDLDQFIGELDAAVEQKRAEQIEKIGSRCSKKIAQIFNDELDSYFASPSDDTWDKVLKFFFSTVDLILQNYVNAAGETDFGVGASTEDNSRGVYNIRKSAWLALDSKLREITLVNNVVAVLQDKFDELFRYDKSGVPVVWTVHHDIETPFVEARDHALKLVDIFAEARLSDGTKVIPNVEFDADEEIPNFSTRLSDSKKAEVIAKFKRLADTAFVEAKRSTTQSATQIPWYMFVLLVLLGWNEFMAVLRNPFLFMFVIMAAGGAWITFSLNMWGPIGVLVNTMVAKTVEISKEKLREVLEVHPQPVPVSSSGSPRRPASARPGSFNRPQTPHEEIELDDM
ncbi:protein Sey1p [Trichomonascus vanleenenianus]|uniref:dynamin-like GTPase SEY1 n=1 Tax=Trichomonascus vanleenenianus TaxID=2268995 RepID=UPI003EC9FF57